MIGHSRRGRWDPIRIDHRGRRIPRICASRSRRMSGMARRTRIPTAQLNFAADSAGYRSSRVRTIWNLHATGRDISPNSIRRCSEGCRLPGVGAPRQPRPAATTGAPIEDARDAPPSPADMRGVAGRSDAGHARGLTAARCRHAGRSCVPFASGATWPAITDSPWVCSACRWASWLPGDPQIRYSNSGNRTSRVVLPAARARSIDLLLASTLLPRPRPGAIGFPGDPSPFARPPIHHPTTPASGYAPSQH
jgi:hypothetical protein